jgi:hypothetical protein
MHHEQLASDLADPDETDAVRALTSALLVERFGKAGEGPLLRSSSKLVSHRPVAPSTAPVRARRRKYRGWALAARRPR